MLPPTLRPPTVTTPTLWPRPHPGPALIPPREPSQLGTIIPAVNTNDLAKGVMAFPLGCVPELSQPSICTGLSRGPRPLH